MASDLKPCPWCGVVPVIRSNRDWHRIWADHGSFCMIADVDLAAPATDDQRDALVEDWNRRVEHHSTPDSTTPDMLTDIVEQLQQRGLAPVADSKDGAAGVWMDKADIAALLGHSTPDTAWTCPECGNTCGPSISYCHGHEQQRHAPVWRHHSTPDSSEAGDTARLLDALRAAEEVMNYMGDILNGMDAVTAEDEAFAKPRWEKVCTALDGLHRMPSAPDTARPQPETEATDGQ